MDKIVVRPIRQQIIVKRSYANVSLTANVNTIIAATFENYLDFHTKL